MGRFGGVDHSFPNLRPAAILTNAYVGSSAPIGTITASTTAPTAGLLSTQVMFKLAFTIGSLTQLNAKVRYSDDGSNWYSDVIQDATAKVISASEWQGPTYERVYVFNASGNFAISAPTKSKFVDLFLQGIGTVTGSSATVTAVIGGV